MAISRRDRRAAKTTSKDGAPGRSGPRRGSETNRQAETPVRVRLAQPEMTGAPNGDAEKPKSAFGRIMKVLNTPIGPGSGVKTAGRVTGQLVFPRTSWDIHADLMPRGSKRMSSGAGRQVAMAVIILIIALGGGGYAIRSLHLADGMGIPLLSDEESTSQEAVNAARTAASSASTAGVKSTASSSSSK